MFYVSLLNMKGNHQRVSYEKLYCTTINFDYCSYYEFV